MTARDSSVDVLESDVRGIESREYELAAVATVRLDGPFGERSIRRSYEALPRHNDTVHREGANSNDDFLDRPDAVHVHSKYYRFAGGEETYLGDRHEIWQVDLDRLVDAELFLATCEDHHHADLESEYDWLVDGREGDGRSMLTRSVPDGWTRLS